MGLRSNPSKLLPACVQTLHDEGACDRSLADRGCDALYGAGPNVSCGEHTSHARLQGQPLIAEFVPCNDEAVLVPLNAIWDPLRVWHSPNEHQEGRRGHRLGNARRRVAKCETLELAVPGGSDNLGARANANIRRRPDLFNEVVRHPGCK